MASLHQRSFSAAEVGSAFSHGGWNAGPSRGVRCFYNAIFMKLDIRQKKKEKKK